MLERCGAGGAGGAGVAGVAGGAGCMVPGGAGKSDLMSDGGKGQISCAQGAKLNQTCEGCPGWNVRSDV